MHHFMLGTMNAVCAVFLWDVRDHWFSKVLILVNVAAAVGQFALGFAVTAP